MIRLSFLQTSDILVITRHYFKEVLLCHIQVEEEVTQEAVIQAVIPVAVEVIRVEGVGVHIVILTLCSREAILLSCIAVQEDRGLCILITRIIPKR